MKNYKWLIGLIPCALMGCAGDDGALIQGGTASAAQMQQGPVVQAIAGFLNFTKMSGGSTPTPPGNPLPGGVGALSIGPFATPYDDCKEILADDDTDVDGDQIPVHVKIRYNCTAVPSTSPGSTGKGKFIGLFEQRDLKDVDATTKYAAGGYEFSYDLHEVNADPPVAGVAPWETFWKGAYSAKATATSLALSSDFAFWVIGDHPPVAPSTKWTKLDWGIRTSHKSVYKPASMASPFTEGEVGHEGLFKIEGSVGPDMQGRDLGSVKVVFKVTSSGLVYDSGCGKYYDSGEMSFEGSPGTKLTLKFACNTVEAFFNGKPITLTGL